MVAAAAAASSGGALLVVFALASGIIYKVTDFLKTVVYEDLKWKIATEWWALVSWALGIGLAYLACNVDTFRAFAGLPADASCTGMVLTGLGFGSIPAFWHTLVDRVKTPTPEG